MRSAPFTFSFRLKFEFLNSHACYMPRPPHCLLFYQPNNVCLSEWPRGLRRRPAAARLLRLWFRIPPGAWMFVCWECCVLSGRGLCDWLITRPEESYRLVRRCVWWRNLVNEEALAHWGLSHQKQTNNVQFTIFILQFSRSSCNFLPHR